MPRATTLTDSVSLVASLRRGDKVGLETPHGSILIGKVVIPSGTHAAVRLIGAHATPHGTPAVVTPSNIRWKGSPRHQAIH